MIIKPELVPNKKLGYYVCDNKQFTSKISACFYALSVHKPVQWIFNNNAFDHYDWTREPSLSLDDLYKKRAREIREKYDYVILSYSGGADSHNVYHSFYSQGLHIDEIYINNMMSASEKFIHTDASNFNCLNAPEVEYKLNQIPRIKEIQTQSPRTKISNFDLSDHIFEYLGNNDETWVLNQREGLNPVNLTRFNYLHFAEVKKHLDKGKKVALITGIDKPQTFIRKGNFYIKFVDRVANINSVADHTTEYDNCTVEYFYWAPESADMLCKQGHVIKRWLELTPEKQEMWLEHRIDKKMIRTVHERILRVVLYESWNNDWFQADKSLSDWRNEFDFWFHNYYRDTDAWKNWDAGIRLLRDNLKPFLKYNKRGEPDGLRPISHEYNLGPINLRPDLASWFV